MIKQKEKKKSMSTSVDEPLHSWFTIKAFEEKRSVANLMVIAMEEYKERNEEK